MFDSHPAGFESLAAAASDNERICSHGCAGPMKPVHQADPAPSTSSLARVSGMLYSSAGDCARTRDVDVSISKHPLKYRKAVLSGGHLGGSSGALQKNHPLRAKMSLKETLKRCGSASPHDSSRNHPSIFAVRSAPKKDQLKGRSASEEPGVNHGKDWKPPKELCHLLDGMFEVRGKDARASNTSSHEKDLPSCTPCDTETNIREKVVTPAESPICNGSTESTKRKHLQVHSKHTLQARLANTGVLKRQLAPSVPLRARGRVLMSDSEDSDSNYS